MDRKNVPKKISDKAKLLAIILFVWYNFSSFWLETYCANIMLLPFPLISRVWQEKKNMYLSLLEQRMNIVQNHFKLNAEFIRNFKVILSNAFYYWLTCFFFQERLNLVNLIRIHELSAIVHTIKHTSFALLKNYYIIIIITFYMATNL